MNLEKVYLETPFVCFPDMSNSKKILGQNKNFLEGL